MAKIERSNQVGKFTLSEIRAKVAESNRFWSSPEGKAERRRLDAEKRNHKLPPTRFPELAKRGTKPALSNPLAARKSLYNHIR